MKTKNLSKMDEWALFEHTHKEVLSERKKKYFRMKKPFAKPLN
jgi:hypothetical protein